MLTDRKTVTINQDGESDVKLDNKEVLVNNEETIMKILNQGDAIRKKSLTKMNESSSRSHAIFRVVSSASLIIQHAILNSKLSFTDYRVRG